MSAGFALCVLLAFVSQKLLNNFVNALCYKLVRDLRKDAFYSLTAAPVKYADTHAQGDVMARVVNDVDIISDGLLQGVAQLFTGVATILGTLVVMFVINYIIALVVVVLTPLSLFVAAFITRRTFKNFSAQVKVQGRLAAHTKEMLAGQKTVVLSDRRRSRRKSSNRSTQNCMRSAGARSFPPRSPIPAPALSTRSSMPSSACSAPCSACKARAARSCSAKWS